ncbi:hypothetical protein C1645_737823 [Glomus cerebriforme]|uniref:Uncharacterized protein n=1 Tax=Glomus cerebriforme TaxID=658196 RepID=A0A397T323_9GLOM|nr:hypothetical protein C1645_737823 [Glomus cerebriforme]
MWIHPEGGPRAIKLMADISLVEDLDDLANVLTREIKGNECKLRLKVMIEGKKSYSEWELKEVLTEILKDKYDSITMMPVLDFQEFPSESFSKSLIKDFVKALKRVFSAYRKETDEQVCREYISMFLRFAVYHAKCNINDEIWITDEWELKGTRGNGPVDYIIFVGTIIVLISADPWN